MKLVRSWISCQTRRVTTGRNERWKIRDVSDNLQVFLREGSFCLSFLPLFFFLHATFGSVIFAFLLLSLFLHATFGSVPCAFLLLSSFYTLHLRKPFSQDVIVSHSCPFSRYPCYTCYRDGKAGVSRSVVFKTDASKCLLSVDPRRRAEHPATLKFKFRFLPAEFSRRTLSGQSVGV